MSNVEHPNRSQVEYPDWLPGETVVVKKRLGPGTTWDKLRREVIKKHGRIYENVVTQSEAEYMGYAFFRVARPQPKGKK